jgi:hypothetical protein
LNGWNVYDEKMLDDQLAFMATLSVFKVIDHQQHPIKLRRSLASNKSSLVRSNFGTPFNRRLASLIYRFLVTCVILQDIDLTETNTRSEIFLKSFPSTSELYRAEVRRTRRHLAENESGRNDVVGQKLKISPTRIRFTSSKQLPIDLERFMRHPQQQQQHTSGDVNIKRRQQPRPNKDQAAPKQQAAYEYHWPINQQTNQVLVNYRRVGRQEKSSNLLRPNHGDGESLVTIHANKIEPDRRAGRARNAIPRPMKASPASVVSQRVPWDGRSVKKDFESRRKKYSTSGHNRNGRRGAADHAKGASKMTVDVRTKRQDELEDRDADDSNSDMNKYEIQVGDAQSDENPPSNGEQQTSVNLEVLDDNNVEEQVDPVEKVKYSPVYPPGDLDILYSDALLVYVKDFNRSFKQ